MIWYSIAGHWPFDFCFLIRDARDYAVYTRQKISKVSAFVNSLSAQMYKGMALTLEMFEGMATH